MQDTCLRTVLNLSGFRERAIGIIKQMTLMTRGGSSSRAPFRAATQQTLSCGQDRHSPGLRARLTVQEKKEIGVDLTITCDLQLG
jgi:hypothetical protein